MIPVIFSIIGRKGAILAAVVIAMGFGVLWLRADAVADERAKQEAAANAARLENIEGSKNDFKDVQGRSDDALGDALDRVLGAGNN